jgi:hypothetical protein
MISPDNWNMNFPFRSTYLNNDKYDKSPGPISVSFLCEVTGSGGFISASDLGSFKITMY